MCLRKFVIPFLVFLQWHVGGAMGVGPAGVARNPVKNDQRFLKGMPSVHKCCPRNQALVSGRGCIRSSTPSSAYLTHLQNSMQVREGFPVPPREQACEMMVLRRNVEHRATWWISRVGLLAVEAPQGELAIHNYCLDDLLDETTNVVSPSAVTCVHELNGEVQLPLSAFRAKTVGKCCARDQHFSTINKKCQAGSEGVPDWEVPIPGADNETQLGYTGFPKCPAGQYLTYYFNEKYDRYVQLANNLSMIVIKMDGPCIEKQMVVNLNEYCFDYDWDGSGEAKPLAVTCAPKPPPLQRPKIGGPLLVFFLSLSCIVLILTMFFLVALQAKGIVHHIPQTGPLAPRTHLTYVGTLLVSFLVLAVAVKQEAHTNSASCRTTAGFLLFFLLAGSHWNTALSLESLLIIMRLGTPGWKRYFIHCVWAWGVPAAVTIIALTLDVNRDILPCGTITARVGKFSCFFSVPDAQMLYLYLPILVTLVANLILLLLARHIRITRLLRLELGAMHKRHGGSGGAGNGKNCNTLEDGISQAELHRKPLSAKNSSSKGSNSSIARFGLGTRETQKLWLEAVCLGLWSGITWVIEVTCFAVIHYVLPVDQHWYQYIWHIPAVINALRGFGVFIILVVLPKDSRYYLLQLISNVYEKFGGKPLTGKIPSTRRSSTSTTTTAATTATAGTIAPERMSLSSSDSQLSSHTASMSELHELPRQTEISPSVTASTSLTLKPNGSNLSKSTAERSSSDSKSSAKSNGKSGLKLPSKLLLTSQSVETINEIYHKKSADGLPVKPPRKSIDSSARASMSVENLSKYSGKEDENNSQNLNQTPQTPPKTPTLSLRSKDTHESNPDITATQEVLPPQSDSSPDTPPESPPPTPPTSPPPVVDTSSDYKSEPLLVMTTDHNLSATPISSERRNEPDNSIDLEIPEAQTNSDDPKDCITPNNKCESIGDLSKEPNNIHSASNSSGDNDQMNGSSAEPSVSSSQLPSGNDDQ